MVYLWKLPFQRLSTVVPLCRPEMDLLKPFDLAYSLKNIPIPSPESYLGKLTEKVESLIKRMRWKAFFFKNNQDGEHQDNFGFKSRKCPPRIEELAAFEEDLLKMIEEVQFRRSSDDFQQRLRTDIGRIRKCKDVIVPADKTRNMYTVGPDQYEKLLQDNITRNYKVAPGKTYDDINSEARDIAESLELGERIECMAKREAYVTLKDHKPNFANAHHCRLINPAKSEIGKVSKAILDRILKDTQGKLQLNLWKSTSAVTDWFMGIPEKRQCTFISFDIVDFYPSITETLLRKALEFAGQFTRISKQDIEIITHARKSMLFGLGKEWIKKGDNLFDVPMGCYDGAEICELVGMFVLATLNATVKIGNTGLYRDDGLGVFRNMSGPAADRTRKKIIKIFSQLGLKITIQCNLKVTDFLDVTLDLSTGKHYPYRKPNDLPVYVHRKSNHPPKIIKNIPASISRRLTDISSDREVFDNASNLYNDALKSSGYDEKVEFMEHRKGTRRQRRKRQRKITWFNPPFSRNVSTNIGRRFRSLVKKHFPRDSPLSKIFNSNNLKISYSCMPNMGNIIRQHNKAIGMNREKPEDTVSKMCNCRVKDQCPMDGNCLMQSVVYKAEVTTEETEREYTGLTAMPFKQRYNNHQQSFKNEKYRHSTALSTYCWSLKESQKEYTIKWSVYRRATPYTNVTKRCNLCLAEKLAIIKSDKSRSLNKRTELISKCRHENKFYLKHFNLPID